MTQRVRASNVIPISYGRAGEVLEDGRYFHRNDVGAMLLRLMEEKKWKGGEIGDEISIRR